MDQQPNPPSDHATAFDTPRTTSASVETDQPCITCGYSLRGLSPSDLCPECGTAVADSLRGDLLFFRNPDYVRTLLRGVSYILNGILLQLVVGILGGIGLVILTTAMGINIPSFWTDFGIPLASTAISVVILIGWWWFSAQDPGVSLEDEPKARTVVRVAVIASLVTAVASLVSPVLPSNPPVREIVLVVAGLLSLAAMATQFFAGMLYVRHMALKLPNEKIHKRAKSRMIACPIWYTVGSLLVIGPLVALVLYWNLLNMVRTALKTIHKAQLAGANEPPAITIR